MADIVTHILAVALFSWVICMDKAQAEFRQAVFTLRDDCPDATFQSSDVLEFIPNSDLFQCIVACMDDPNCLSLAENKDVHTCSHSNVTLSGNCSPGQAASGSKIMEKTIISGLTCMNGGSLNNALCSCTDGYVGLTCERLAEDCAEMGQNSYYTGQEGYYQVQPVLAPAPFTVFCSFLNSYPLPRLYIQRHFTKEIIFDKTWQEYADGFQFGDTDMWLGNTFQGYLTRSRSDYLLVVEMGGQDWEPIYQRAYLGFRVEDESNFFVMTFQISGTYTYPDAGDSFIYVNGSKFTTKDNDQDDINNQDCGNTRGCGFWFTAGTKCGQSSPNGRLIQAANEERLFVEDEIFWTYNLATWSPWYIQMYLERTPA